MEVFYEQTLLATTGGATLSYTWSIVSGSLPDGLSLNFYTGMISGEPVKEGTFYFNVHVIDRRHNVQGDTQALSITILPEGSGANED